MKKKILVLKDDAAIKPGLNSALIDEGYEVKVANTGPDGFRIAEKQWPDLIILDAMVPGTKGSESCERIRAAGSNAQIIMLTTKVDGNDKVLAPELGADDYITRPFSIRELMARVKANLQRQTAAGLAESPGSNGADDTNKFIFGETVVDFKRHEVYKSGQRQDVTNREFKLLEYFIQHPGEVLTRDRLLDEIWGYNVYPTTRTVDNHILRLRKHVEPKPGDPVYIKTVRGAGYLFDLG